MAVPALVTVWGHDFNMVVAAEAVFNHNPRQIALRFAGKFTDQLLRAAEIILCVLPPVALQEALGKAPVDSNLRPPSPESTATKLD